MSAGLVLGPLLRYVGTEHATVWVETDAPCEVAVLGARCRTFHVAGHHYALVVVDGLTPGTGTPCTWTARAHGHPTTAARRRASRPAGASRGRAWCSARAAPGRPTGSPTR